MPRSATTSWSGFLWITLLAEQPTDRLTGEIRHLIRKPVFWDVEFTTETVIDYPQARPCTRSVQISIVLTGNVGETVIGNCARQHHRQVVRHGKSI